MSLALDSLPALLRDAGIYGAPTETATEGGAALLRQRILDRRPATGAQHSTRSATAPASSRNLPAFFIARLTAPGETVYDPFSGRGTTAMQAALMGRRPVGNDINPLARCCWPGRGCARRRWRRSRRGWAKSSCRGRPRRGPRPTCWRSSIPTRCARSPPCALLARARGVAERSGPVDDWIRMVALNRLTGHSPGFFSVYTLPPNQAVSVAAQRKINADARQTPPPRDVAALILRKSAPPCWPTALPPPHPPPLLMTGPAHDDAGVADGIGRSDRHLAAVPRCRGLRGDNWLRCWFAGIDAGRVADRAHRTSAAWQASCAAPSTSSRASLRPGGYVAFEVGEVRGGRVLLERARRRGDPGLPFRRRGHAEPPAFHQDRAMLGRRQQQAAAPTATASCWPSARREGGRTRPWRSERRPLRR